ncbi:hypothetical protein [Moorena sp. SIO3H5]|uniref:hypothetical protein n=1 Tax=Moorena sp. SIO3H5 TaxID=2607834 RepID=UPI0025D11322|nr:hypothetical protein [Moorena sp. SIO3H5]
MANIKVNQLQSEKTTDEIIDLKAKADDSPEFKAFTTVRGGHMACFIWSLNL